MNRLFESKAIAEAYKKYRPQPPQFIVDEAIKYLRDRSPPSKDDDGKFGRLVDVGCGSGQSTAIFAPYFRQITGVDPSENQIERAKADNKIAHIEYKVGSGERLPLEDGSVDMVLVGQAVHWFDWDRFFRECARVLTPSGCLFAFGYCQPRVSLDGSDDEQLNRKCRQVVRDFLDDRCRFDSRIARLDDGYREFLARVPSHDKRHGGADREMTQRMTLQDFVNYVSSFSGYRNHVTDTVAELMRGDARLDEREAARVYADQHDILKEMEATLRRLWSVPDARPSSQVAIRVACDVPMVMASRLEV